MTQSVGHTGRHLVRGIQITRTIPQGDWVMSLPVAMPRLPLHHVFYPSDFSPASEVAFAHALKLALAAKAEFRLMHVAPEASAVHWTDFPGVRALLARWGLLPEGSPRQDVAKLGINV